MFFYAAILVSIIGLIIATYTDLKERIVTNKLNFSLAIIGLIIYSIQSIIEQNTLPITYSILGLFSGFLFGWIMWKLGVFAGGDVKLFMGLGALNPFTPALIKIGTLTTYNTPLFPITLFIYALFAFLPYGLFVVIYKLSKNKPFRENLIIETKKRIKDGVHLSIFTGAMYTILIIAQINTGIILIILILWGLFKEKKIIITGLVTIIALLFSPYSFAENSIKTFIFVGIIYGVIKLMLSLRPLLIQKVKVNKLEEGMIPAKTLIWSKGKVLEKDAFSLKEIIKIAKTQNLKEIFSPKKEIISSTKARGLTDEEINELKKLSKKGLIGKEMLVKESMPFVPTMLLGYILCLIIGDFIWFIFLG